MDNNKKTIEIDVELYEKLITENVSYKKDLEHIKNNQKEVELEISSNTPPTPNNEKEKKKGIF